MREQDAVKLDAICQACSAQLLLVRSYGLVGYLRVSDDNGVGMGWGRETTPQTASV